MYIFLSFSKSLEIAFQAISKKNMASLCTNFCSFSLIWKQRMIKVKRAGWKKCEQGGKSLKKVCRKNPRNVEKKIFLPAYV